MRFADAKTVHRVLDYPSLIDALREAHRGPAPSTDHIVATEPGDGANAFVALLGWKRRAAVVVKMVGVFPGNLALDPPQASVQGLVAVFSPDTGAPLLVADGEAMTFRKTAADSALGASFLARPDGRIVAQETVVDGLEHAVDAFLGLLSGSNTGKMVVRVGG